MARTKQTLRKKAAAKKALVAEKLLEAEKRRQVVRLRFQKGVKKAILARQLTGETLLSRNRVRKLCGCVLSRPDPKRCIDYTPNTLGMFSSSSGRRFCDLHLDLFLAAQKH
jgi:hypothetical protein